MARAGFVARFLKTCAVAAFLGLVAACGGGGGGGEPVRTVTTVTVSSPTSTPKQGDTVQLTAVARDQFGDVVPGTTATWSSSAPSVATVSATGLLRALTAGSVVVTATVNGVSGSLALTVVPGLVASAPDFTMQPAEQSVTASTVARFTSAVSGVPTPVLQWQQSSDNGATWTAIAGATEASYAILAASSDNGKRYRLVATNAVGSAVSDAVALYVNPSTVTLACSRPNGSGWCQISPVQPNTLYAVTKVEASTLVAVGQAGTILRSVDGGLTWVAVQSGTSVALYAVAFAGAGLGIAVGESGTILRSVDGGLTWSTAISGTMLRLTGVSFAGNNGAAFAVGSDSVFRSTDGGQVWSLVGSYSACWSASVCSPYRFTDIAFADASTGVAVDSSGRAIRSTDGGATWNDVAMGNYGEPLNAVAFAGPGFGVAVGGGCATALETSTDAGQSWVFRGEEPIAIMCPPHSFSAVSLPTTRLGFVVGSSGVAIMRTADGGATWAPTAPSGVYGNSFALLGVAFINPATGVAVGADGAILLTSTGGL